MAAEIIGGRSTQDLSSISLFDKVGEITAMINMGMSENHHVDAFDIKIWEIDSHYGYRIAVNRYALYLR